MSNPNTQASMGPDDPQLAVTLPKSSWDAIVSLLGQRPYSEVQEIIGKIIVQTGSQWIELQLIQALWAAPVAPIPH